MAVTLFGIDLGLNLGSMIVNVVGSSKLNCLELVSRVRARKLRFWVDCLRKVEQLSVV